MQALFNSKGYHIANFNNNQLYNTSGDNIGHYLDSYQIFIDMDGKYLGEILYKNRLIFNYSSPYKSINFGMRGNYGSIGSYGNYGNCGSIGLLANYSDVNL